MNISTIQSICTVISCFPVCTAASPWSFELILPSSLLSGIVFPSECSAIECSLSAFLSPIKFENPAISVRGQSKFLTTSSSGSRTPSASSSELPSIVDLHCTWLSLLQTLCGTCSCASTSLATSMSICSGYTCQSLVWLQLQSLLHTCAALHMFHRIHELLFQLRCTFHSFLNPFFCLSTSLRLVVLPSWHERWPPRVVH